MERNPNSWRLLAMFFAMALLFVLAPINASIVPPARVVEYELINAPPGQIVAVVVIETLNMQIISAPTVCQQIARGVSVPYLGLINNDCIVFEDFTNYQCNIYYTISRIDLKLEICTGFKNEIDKYPFAADLGLRWTSSVKV